MPGRFGVLLGIMLVVVACADGGSPVRDQAQETPTLASSSSTSTVTTTTLGRASSTTTMPTTTSTTTIPATSSTVLGSGLPGTASEDGPIPESIWWVVGVGADDSLNVRSVPGTGGAVVATMAPDGGPLVASGEARWVASSLWWKVERSGDQGWVNARYLGAMSETRDITSWLVEQAGAIPTAMSMDALAVEVVALRGGGDATVIHAGLSADGLMGETAVDVFTDPDDSVRGERLRVFGQRMDVQGAFGLYAVEATVICWRGVDDLLRCV